VAIAPGFGKAIRAQPKLQAHGRPEQIPMARPDVGRRQRGSNVCMNGKGPGGPFFLFAIIMAAAGLAWIAIVACIMGYCWSRPRPLT